MALPPISRTDLENAKIDAADLADFVSDVAGDVTPRTGTTYPNIRKLVDNFNEVLAEQVVQEETATAQAEIATTKAEEAAESAEQALGAKALQVVTGDDPFGDAMYLSDTDTGLRPFRVSKEGVARDQNGKRYLKDGDVDLNALSSIQKRDGVVDAEGVPVRFATIDLDTGLIVTGDNEEGNAIGLAAGSGGGGGGGSSDLIYIDYDPNFATTGVDRRLRVLLPSLVEGSEKWAEVKWHRSTDPLATGTWRRINSYEATLTNTSALTTTLGIMLSGAGYSGPGGPWGGEGDASNVSYDDNEQTVYTVSPFNFSGGGDIHKNNYPLYFAIFVDGAPIDLTQPLKAAAREVRIIYIYKVLRSRNPQLPSSDAGFVNVFEDVILNADEHITQHFRCKYLEQATFSAYVPIECIDEWPTAMERDTSAGVETFNPISDYDSGDNNKAGVSYVRFWNEDGYACEMRVGAPETQLSANVPWGTIVPSPFDLFTMKLDGDDPYKVYWNTGGPGTFTAYNGLRPRQFAGDEWRRVSNIKYYIP